MECPACGRTNPQGAGTCNRCGGRLVAEAAPPRDAPLEETRGVGPEPGTFWSGDPAAAPTLAGSDRSEEATRADSSASGAGATLEVGQTIGERYEIVGVIGEGGCGIVYRARDLALDRTVALKTIHPSVAANASALERFKREILLASKITHRNVVRIHDLGEVGDLKFISMEFIEGVDLKQIVKREAPLPRERAIGLLRQIAEALDAAHQAGVVHRDLKPQNVLVDASGRAYIADFGISRSIDHGQTMTEAGTLLGTVAYMSPEQARGETADHRSDIYSLGLILYEMLTGEQPFKSDNPLSQLMKRVEAEVPTVELTRSDLPSWLVRIVARCLAREPAARYQSVRELLEDLDAQRAKRVKRGFTPGRRIAMAVAATAMLVAIVATLRPWSWRAETAPPAVRASLIVAPFRNVSGNPRDDWTREGLPNLLRAELLQSRDLRLADEARAHDVVQGLDLAAGGALRDDQIVTLSRLAGVENVLLGDLVRVGTRYRVEAELVRAGTASIAARTSLRAEGEGDDSLFAIVDDLSHQVRSELGLGRPWRGGRSAEELSTSSVEALRLYSEGDTLVRKGSDVEAAEQLTAALEVDPEFWLARALLAETLVRLGRQDEALVQADRAAVGLNEAPPYEAARIRAVGASLAGDVDAARLAYEELTRLAPNLPDSHMALGTFLEESGDLEGALLSLNRVLALDGANPGARYVRGRVHAKLGQPEKSIEDFQAALGYHEAAHNEEGRATVLMGLGNVHRRLGEHDRALEYYNDALKIRQELGDDRGEAAALNNVAVVQRHQGAYAEAMDSWNRALEIYHGIDYPAGEAEIHANLGDLESTLGRPQEALRHYQDGMRLLRDGGDAAGLARAMANLGFINQVLGRYDEAHLMLEQALKERRSQDDARELLTSLLDMGNIELVIGRFDSALAHYVEGLALADQSGDEEALLALKINLALVHAERGDYGPALSEATEALDQARKSGNASFLGLSLVTFGGIRAAIGDAGGATAALDDGLAEARQTSNKTVEAETLIQLGHLQLATGERELALASFGRAVKVAGEAQEHRLLLPARLGQAWAKQSVGELTRIRKEAEQADLDHQAARASLALARVHLEHGRNQEAASEADRALALAAGLREIQFRAHWVAARALSEARMGDRAAEHARAALESWAAILEGLSGNAAAAQIFRESPSTRAFANEIGGLLPAAERETLERLLRADPGA